MNLGISGLDYPEVLPHNSESGVINGLRHEKNKKVAECHEKTWISL